MHFAITSKQQRALFAADDNGDSDTVGELLEEIEESWSDDGLKVDTDKAWDAIHRCLTDGTLDPDGGEYPLSHTVLGGRHLHDEHHIVYVSAVEVRDVADALRDVERTWLRRRFDAIDDPDFAVHWTTRTSSTPGKALLMFEISTAGPPLLDVR